MPKRFICRQGHQWGADGPTPGQVAACPVCGAAGQRLRAPGSVAQGGEPVAITVPPQLHPPTTDDVGRGDRSLKTLPPGSSPENPALPLAPETSDDPAAAA